MLFNSFAFIFLFLPLSLGGYFVLAKANRHVLARAWLVVSSLIFYGYWNFSYVPLLLISIALNFVFGMLIRSQEYGSRLSTFYMMLGVGINLALLAFYKYTKLFLSTLNYWHVTNVAVPDIVLPLGISFFTFTQIAYLVDVYREERAEYQPVSYSLFVTFFPHLIAGPVLYHKAVVPQLQSDLRARFSVRSVSTGLAMFTIGLAKKVLIADNVAAYVGPVFSHAANATMPEAWIGVTAYALQIFFDFSGYSDMAFGLARMMNIRIPTNFNSPYKASSIIDFWQRWHTSLSYFLRSYLFMPIVGYSLSGARQAMGLMLTMLLGGLWHGADWTFMIWGGLHGCFLIVNHLWRKLKIKLNRHFCITLTFICVAVSFAFFRAESVAGGCEMVKAMFGFHGMAIPQNLALLNKLHLNLPIREGQTYMVGGFKSVLVIAFLLLVVSWMPSTDEIAAKFKPTRRWMVALSVLLSTSLLSLNRVSSFIYYQF